MLLLNGIDGWQFLLSFKDAVLQIVGANSLCVLELLYIYIYTPEMQKMDTENQQILNELLFPNHHFWYLHEISKI